MGWTMALTSSITRKSFPPIRLRAVINEELETLLRSKEGGESLHSNRSFQRSALIYVFMSLGAPREGRGNMKKNKYYK